MGHSSIAAARARLQEAEVLVKEYQQLVGAVITGIAVTPDNEFVGLKLMLCRGLVGPPVEKIAWVQQDPEGNGPGFLAIEDVG